MRRARLTVALAAFAVVCAGCGGSDMETGAASTPSPTMPGTAVEEEEQAAPTAATSDTTVESEEQAAPAPPAGGALERALIDLLGVSPEKLRALSQEEFDALWASSLGAEDLSIQQQQAWAYVFSLSFANFVAPLAAAAAGPAGQEQAGSLAEPCADPDAFAEEVAPGVLEGLYAPIPEHGGESVFDGLNLTVDEVYADLSFVVNGTCEDQAVGPIPTPDGLPTPLDSPAGFTSCGPGANGVRVFANEVTSCAFALNVADAWTQPGDSLVLFDVPSPVTGQTYDMQCSDTDPVRCTGGNNAAVLIHP